MYNLGIFIRFWTKNEVRNIVFLLLNLVQDILKKLRFMKNYAWEKKWIKWS